MTLENLVRIGKLKPHKPTPQEIAKLLLAVRRNLRDARVDGLSPESRFDLAYKAIMQSALIAVLANGFRPSTNEPGHHATVIQSLVKTVNVAGDFVIVLDQLRKKRNLSDYSGEGISEEDAAACMRTAEKLLSTVEQWLRASRPDLMA